MRKPKDPGRQWLYGSVVLAFLGSELLARWLGVRFADNTLGLLYQYLDPVILSTDLTRGLYYLHAQPPLFNLYLGVVLKLFPQASTAAFAVSFGAAGLGLLLGLAWLLERLGVSRWISGVLCALLACSPGFVAYRHWLFYTLPVAFLLVGMAVFLLLYIDSGRPRWSRAFCAAAAALMLTRAVYHPLWLVAVLAAVVPLLDGRRRKALSMAAIAPLLLVTGLYLKNYLLVGHFSGSSWLGMNLAKRWPLSQREMASLRGEGKIPPYWHRRPFQEPEAFRPYGFFAAGLGGHPALVAAYQSNGEPNFNHRDYARISREMLRGDLYLIRHYPGRYLQRAWTAFLLFLQPGPNSVHFLVDYDFSRMDAMKELWTRLFLGGPIERPIRMLEPPLNLWLLGFPILLGVGAFRVVKRDRATASDPRPLFAFILVTVLWVTLTGNLIEIGENDRLRWEVEPLLVVLLGAALSLLPRLKRP